MQRVHLVVSGDVQGVGFRAWAKAQARQVDLTGWVRNNPDKTVEIVVEGDKEILDAFIARIHKGPELSVVRDVDIEWLVPTGEYSTFRVLY